MAYLKLMQIENTNFDLIVKENIIDKGGFISFNWWLERCGNVSCWTLLGYLPNNEPIKIEVFL